MPTTPVDLQKTQRIFAAQVLRGIKYRLGGKAPSLSATPSHLSAGIDCSGETRLLLFQGTDGALTIPDGSWNQRAWCEKNLEEVPYSRAIHAKPGELFIAFISTGVNGAGRIGHVWLVAQSDSDTIAETMESYGGHGIGSRPANTGVLTRLVHKCFQIPTHETTSAPQSTPPLSPALTPSKPLSSPTPELALFLNDVEISSARLENGHYTAPVGDVLRALRFSYATDPARTTPTELRLKVWRK